MSFGPVRIFKVVRADELSVIQERGVFSGSADDRRDGFVHLVTEEQIASVVARSLAGEQPLFLLELDVAALGEHPRFERGGDGALYPHLHIGLPWVAVTSHRQLDRALRPTRTDIASGAPRAG